MPIDVRLTATQYAVQRIGELNLTTETVADRIKANLLSAVFQEIAELGISTIDKLNASASRLEYLITEIERLADGITTPEAIAEIVADWNTQPNFIQTMADAVRETLAIEIVEIPTNGE